MKYDERLILNTLLDKYEGSKAFLEGSSARRVQVSPQSDARLSGCWEDADGRKDLLEALARLKEDGLADYSWVRFEKGNLVEKIWLNTDEAALAKSYGRAGREPKQKGLSLTAALLKDAVSSMDEGDLKAFTRGLLEKLEKEKRVPRYLFAETEREKNRRLLAFLTALSRERDEELERVISSRLYGDSKYFEHELKSKALSILKAIAKEQGQEWENEEELLACRGVVKWPEILEFAGPVRLILDDGGTIDFGGQRWGACVNAQTVRHALSLEGEVSQITSIENKANYTWYLANLRQPDELVLYHGGFYSPVKKALFSFAAKAFPDVPCRHWSDIDLGGFRIFVRLKREIFPGLVPWRMDRETLLACRDRCGTWDSAEYGKALRALLDDEDYAVFREVMETMLEYRIRLEQETLIWQEKE